VWTCLRKARHVRGTEMAHALEHERLQSGEQREECDDRIAVLVVYRYHRGKAQVGEGESASGMKRCEATEPDGECTNVGSVTVAKARYAESRKALEDAQVIMNIGQLKQSNALPQAHAECNEIRKERKKGPGAVENKVHGELDDAWVLRQRARHCGLP
jgi:hypothetical protein